MRTPDSAPGALPEAIWEHSRRLSGSTPGGYPGALPEAIREHSRRLSGSTPGGYPGALPEHYPGPLSGSSARGSENLWYCSKSSP